MPYNQDTMKHNTTHWNVLVIGALLVCNFACVGAYAQEETNSAEYTTPKSKWMDPQPKHVGLMWNAGADIVSNYVWRGLYVGGLGVQADFMVGYGGLFLDMWWNVGATDWTFKTPYKPLGCALNPEVDMTIGFSRWGLTVMFMHMYYFDKYVGTNRYGEPERQIGDNSRYFDFGNHGPGEGGITQEWRIKYKVSSKLPLSFLWCTRTWGRDGYYQKDENGEYVSDANGDMILKRAYSSYFEINYDWKLPYEFTLSTAVGLTPWKSMYTGFQGDFAVNNVSVKLTRSWDLGKHLYMTGFANMMMNPYDLAIQANPSLGEVSVNGGRKVLWNVGCGFYFK